MAGRPYPGLGQRASRATVRSCLLLGGQAVPRWEVHSGKVTLERMEIRLRADGRQGEFHYNKEDAAKDSRGTQKSQGAPLPSTGYWSAATAYRVPYPR